MGGGGGMGGMGGGGGERPLVTVRWESAAPVREAHAKAEDRNAAQIAQWSAQYYVISVTGARMMGGRAQHGGEGTAKAQRAQPNPAQLEQMRERMKQSAVLRRKGQPPIAPVNTGVLELPAGRQLVFLFSRDEAISPDDREVAFEVRIGPMNVKAKFAPKDMLYHGKLEL